MKTVRIGKSFEKVNLDTSCNWQKTLSPANNILIYYGMKSVKYKTEMLWIWEADINIY